MTPAERFVVVAGAALLVFNLILFSLCLSLVLDSKAVRNDTAQLIALTDRLLENQQALSELPMGSKQQWSQEGCPLLQDSTSPTTFQPDVPVTQDVTEMAVSTESDLEEELSDEQRKIKTMEERIIILEKTVENLKNRDDQTTAPSAKLRRRRNGGSKVLLS